MQFHTRLLSITVHYLYYMPCDSKIRRLIVCTLLRMALRKHPLCPKHRSIVRCLRHVCRVSCTNMLFSRSDESANGSAWCAVWHADTAGSCGCACADVFWIFAELSSKVCRVPDFAESELWQIEPITFEHHKVLLTEAGITKAITMWKMS